MNSNQIYIKVIFYTKKRYIGEEFFQKNITLYDIKQYFKEYLNEGTTLFYKSYYINSIKLADSDIIYNFISPTSNIIDISIALELREVEELKYQFSFIKFDDEDEEVYSQIIKPKLNPFGLIVFLTKNRSIQIEQYPTDIINKYNLGKFNKNSAYCNTPNYIYLSGENNFWIINKKTYAISHFKLKISKTNHSLGYAPDIGVFMVGGETKQTYLYDIKNKKFIKWGDTNNFYYKPALIYYDEYLFCFHQINKKSQYFEKTYLGENTKKKWEIIYPRFKDVDPKEFYKNDFAVSKSMEGKILLIGGNKNQKNTYIFNPLNDTIIKTPGDNERINFDEKIFYKLNKIINIAIPSDFEKNYELALLNKYQFSLQKAKYKNVQKGININSEFDLDKNIELINDNQIGNVSIKAKFEGIDYNNKKFKFKRIIGLSVFSHIYYFKYNQQFQRCICPPNVNHGSHNNLFKINIGIRNEKLTKRNNSHINIIKRISTDNVNKNKIENKFENNIKRKENANKNINTNAIKILHKRVENIKITKTNINKNKIINNNEIVFNKKEEQNKKEIDVKTNEQQNSKFIDNSKKEEINPLNNEIINSNKKTVKQQSDIIDLKKEELIKEEIKIEESPKNIIINDEKNQEEKIKEEFKESEEKKEPFKESLIVTEKQKNDKEESFNIFSNIKEMRNNPNYDIDESKTNKDLYKSNVTNFLLKESLQRNVISTKFNIKSNEKNTSSEKQSSPEKKIQTLENIEIKEPKYEMIENNINKQGEEKEGNEFNLEKIKDNCEEEKKEDYNKEEQFEEVQKEKENVGSIEEYDKEKKSIINMEDNFEQFEEEYGNESNIKKEINEEKVHEDIEPNNMNNINEKIYLNQQENYNEYRHYQKNSEKNTEKNNNEDLSDDDNDLDENIINNEQNEQSLSENDLNNPNKKVINEVEKTHNDKNKIKNLKERININIYSSNFESNGKNKIGCLEPKVIKNESDLSIKFQQEESKEIGFEDNNPSKKEENNIKQENPLSNIDINIPSNISEGKDEKMYHDSSKKSKKEEEKIINIDNIINNFINENNLNSEEDKEGKDEQEQASNEEYNSEEGGEEENIDNDEINNEENIDQMIQDNYEEQNYEEQNGEEENEYEYENNVDDISYEPDEDEKEINKEKERDSIIHISDNENINNQENDSKENDLQKYQKFVKNVEYDFPENDNN